jgi:hypothetical protein
MYLIAPTLAIFPLRGIEAVGEQGTGMQLKVPGRTLGQNPHSYIRSIGLNHELTGRVRMNQDRAVVKRCLKSRKTRSVAMDHVNGILVEVRADRGRTGCCNPG